jgi:hypothetical protein
MDSIANYIIKIGVQNQQAIQGLSDKVNKTNAAFGKLAKIAAVAFSGHKLISYVQAGVEAHKQQAIAVSQLGQVMRNTMGATKAEVNEIIALTNAQQKLGVVSSATQIAGAKELGTYVTKAESLKKLIPVMNDMLVHQHGVNATQQQAVGIAQMVGKVLDGQTGALSLAGYRFDEAQKHILEYGTEQQRVALLSKIVTQYVGGMNEALANTPEGRLAQVANRMVDIQAKVGKAWLSVKAAFVPAIETVGSVVERFTTWFESNQSKIISSIQTAATVVSGIINGVVSVALKVANAIKWIWDNAQWAIVAVVAFAVAMKASAVAIAAYNAVSVVVLTTIKAIRIATMGWAAAQKVLNILFAVNPVSLIIAGIVALIAVIAYVVYKTDGWGKQWDSVVTFMKYSFMAFVEAVKLYFSTVINGIMIGIDYIKLGWYKFKEALGIGDSSENQSIIAKINADVEARQNAILDGAKKVADYAQKAKDSLKWELSWNKERSLGDLVNGMKKKLGMGDDAAPEATGAGDSGLGLATASSAEAIATGGTRSTNVTINVGNMVENMTFSREDMSENVTDMQTQVMDTLIRVLNFANSAVR